MRLPFLLASDYSVLSTLFVVRAVKLLVDGDVLCYRAGFATDKTKYLVHHAAGHFEQFDDAKSAGEHKGSGVTIWSRKETEPEDKAIMLVDLMLGEIYARFADQNPSLVVLLSGVGNYRHAVATRANYKGNRAGAAQPTHLKAIRNHLQLKHGAIVSHGEEADDLIGIHMTAFPDSVCVSIDKDLKQLPGRHYDFTKKEETTVSAKEASLNFYSQVLSGDSTDNVPGVSGIGPVKARKLLEQARGNYECWQECLRAYAKEFGDISGPLFAIEAAQLVHVRRSVGQMWEPPVAPTKTKQAA